MFKSQKLVYLQLQKTGSTHIAKLLSDILEGKQYTKHSRPPLSVHKKNKYIIGSIRNPWDWYVSLWSFGCLGNGGLYHRITSRIFTGLYNLKYPLNTIRAFINELIKPIDKWRHLYSDWKNPKLFRKWLKTIFNPKRRYDLKEKYGFSPISEYGGFLTYRYLYLYSRDVKKIYSKKYVGNINKLYEFDENNNMLCYVIRNENLENDLINILNKIGVSLSDKIIAKIKSFRKTNTSKRKKSLESYYDRKTSNLVKEKEKFLIDKYNYSEPNIK